MYKQCKLCLLFLLFLMHSLAVMSFDVELFCKCKIFFLLKIKIRRNKH